MNQDMRVYNNFLHMLWSILVENVELRVLPNLVLPLRY